MEKTVTGGARALALLTNPFISGETLHVDGAGRWAW